MLHKKGKKFAKSHENMPKEQQSQHDRATSSQIWDNLHFKINDDALAGGSFTAEPPGK